METILFFSVSLVYFHIQKIICQQYLPMTDDLKEYSYIVSA